MDICEDLEIEHFYPPLDISRPDWSILIITTVVCLVYSVVRGLPNSVTVSWVVMSEVIVEI